MNRNFIIGFVFVMLLVGSVCAGDVAYLYKLSTKIDKNIVNSFVKMNLSVDYISESSLPKNLSGYKVVYVGDEDFLKPIEVNKYASVVSNYYIGEKSGLTDKDGVSRIVSTSILKGNLNSSLIQLYPSARDWKGLALAAYFLDQDNKAKSFETYLGTSSSSGTNFGDIISLGKKGSVLRNGKVLEEDICFFGIIRTDYWTEQSSELFQDCVKYVYDGYLINHNPIVNGSDNNQTIPNNNQTTNPPLNTTSNETTPNNQTIPNNPPLNTTDNQTVNNFLCSSDSDCQSYGFVGPSFCSEKSVLKNVIQTKCIITSENSYCSNVSSNEIIASCSDYCSSGECRNFTCISNEACNDEDPSTEDVCLDASTSDAVCQYTFYNITCSLDIDCDDGNDGTEDLCMNSGSKNSVCIYEEVTCNFDEDCDDGNDITEDVCIDGGFIESNCLHNVYEECVKNEDCNDENENTLDNCVVLEEGNYCSYEEKQEEYIRISYFNASVDGNKVILNFSVDRSNNSELKGYYLSKDYLNWEFSSGDSSGYVFDNLGIDNYTFFIRVIDGSDLISEERNISVSVIEFDGINIIPPSNGGSSGGSSSGGGSGGSSSSASSGSGSDGGGLSGGICVTKWTCTDWSDCKDGKQIRNCYYPSTFCSPKAAKPEESRNCVEEISKEVVEAENDTIKQGFSITGSVIGALQKYSLIAIGLFLAIIVALYLFLGFRKKKRGLR